MLMGVLRIWVGAKKSFLWDFPNPQNTWTVKKSGLGLVEEAAAAAAAAACLWML
jgi:hypothetical protein